MKPSITLYLWAIRCASPVAWSGYLEAAYYNARTRHQQPSVDKYAALRRWLVTFAGEHRRWGYRRAWVKARQAGFTCGRDVVYYLWHQEGLRVLPRKAGKQWCLPVPTPRTQPATSLGHVWALDFQFDSDY
ncbi:IS3 family transposase [Corynebacterium belfantii]|nr:IS3 family transposase [Corynebacterium belfantii]SNW32671.1 hypothetical protein FRC0043_02284 [Corynebacterium belfantii]